MKQEKKAQTDKETLPVWVYFVLSVPFVPEDGRIIAYGQGQHPGHGQFYLYKK